VDQVRAPAVLPAASSCGLSTPAAGPARSADRGRLPGHRCGRRCRSPCSARPFPARAAGRRRRQRCRARAGCAPAGASAVSRVDGRATSAGVLAPVGRAARGRHPAAVVLGSRTTICTSAPGAPSATSSGRRRPVWVVPCWSVPVPGRPVRPPAPAGGPERPPDRSDHHRRAVRRELGSRHERCTMQPCGSVRWWLRRPRSLVLGARTRRDVSTTAGALSSSPRPAPSLAARLLNDPDIRGTT